MASYNSWMQETQDAVLDAIKQGEDFVIGTVATVSERVGEMLPELELPFADQIPDPIELSNQYFDFVGELVKQQKDYTAGLLAAVAPVTGKFIPAAKLRPRKSTTKAA
ncbi:MAG: hypothetical protein ABR518_10355 [Actinomycetota bacterium]